MIYNRLMQTFDEQLTGNEKARIPANKAIKQIKEVEKTLDELSKVINESELDLLSEASQALNVAKLRISKVRGYF